MNIFCDYILANLAFFNLLDLLDIESTFDSACFVFLCVGDYLKAVQLTCMVLWIELNKGVSLG